MPERPAKYMLESGLVMWLKMNFHAIGLLLRLKKCGCWCEAGRGSPNISDHAPNCRRIQEFFKDVDETFKLAGLNFEYFEFEDSMLKKFIEEQYRDYRKDDEEI